MVDELQQRRRRAVQGLLAVTRGTPAAADAYELRLLVRFIQGELTIDQVCALLDEREPPFITRLSCQESS